MVEKSCPNCYFKNDSDGQFCQECGAPLDLSTYVETKKFKGNLIDKLKSAFGNRRINEINAEIEDFIKLSLDFKDYPVDLINLKSGKYDKNEFKNKYEKISALDDFKYLDEINHDEDLNKKLLLLKEARTFINNFDDEIKKLDELLDDVNSKSAGIESFNKDLDEFLNSNSLLETSHKNNLIQVHKATFDFFDRKKVKELEISSKEKIHDFLNTYENIDSIFDQHNLEFEKKENERLLLKAEGDVLKFLEKINALKESKEYVSEDVKKDIENEFKEIYDFLKKQDSLKNEYDNFLKEYSNLNKTIEDINEEVTSIEKIKDLLNSKLEDINEYNEDFKELFNSNFYVTYVERDEFKKKYYNLYKLVDDASKRIDLDDEFTQFHKKYENLDLSVKIRNDAFVRNELIKYKDFFDNIDGKKLDEKQRLVVVKNEMNSQIIAGAGCGKTLTVNAKVRYLIEKKGIDPSDILCLSYSKASVGDLIEKLPEGIEINTFHSLGKNILESNDEPSRIENNALKNYIFEYFSKNVIYNEKLCQDFFEFYSYYFYNSIKEDEVTSIGQVYDIEEARDFTTFRALYGGDNEKRTFDNKTVNSFEELIIANYLFAHQIDYEYEKIFECDNKYFMEQKEFLFNLIFDSFDEIVGSVEFLGDLINDLLDFGDIKEHVKLKSHVPDFYIVENEIYLEHFGVNRNCEALWLDKKDSDNYAKGIRWKRNLHEQYGSTLIETYSYYMSENRLLPRLEEKLKKAGVEIKEIDYKYLISKIVENQEINRYKNFIKLIITFIELFKGNDYTIDKFEEFRKQNQSNDDEFDKKRTELFLNIVEDIYIGYQNHLKEVEKIDFNDMINNATREVEKGNLKTSFKYIIVDEYQDTSYTRYNLLKAIQDKTGAKLCVVGDDWQSIYRFTGCDVELFTKFEKFFENPEKLSIETTYRNSQELIDISGKFIKKNTNQISKSLQSKKPSSYKPVKIAYYNKNSKIDKIKTMELIIDKISRETNNIMILGRNNFDIDVFVEEKLFRRTRDEQKLIYTKNKNLDIKFLSVHKSKGLEEDNVILINLENSIVGFPNQMADDPLISFVVQDSDQYEYGEERRLFYVALTRTKDNVYLLVPDTDKSEFVVELEEDIHKLDILSKADTSEEIFDDIEEFMKDKRGYSITTDLKCPLCKTGDINLVFFNDGSQTIAKYFKCSHRQCTWRGGNYYADMAFINEIEICPECGKIMQVYNGRYGPYLRCPSKCKTPKIKGEKLKRVNEIIKELESDIEFEYYKSTLICPKCGNGNVTLRINPDNNQQKYVCSKDNCDWDGGITSIKSSDLDKIQICPKCKGILNFRKGKYGPFLSCNSKECNYIQNVENKRKKKASDWKKIETDLSCPTCNKGKVILMKNKKTGKGFFTCSDNNCNWKGESFNKSENLLSTLDYCPEDGCAGLTYELEGEYGSFRVCTYFSKTGCKAGNKRKKKGSDWKKVETDLFCPLCGKGDVILMKNKNTGKGFFTCSNEYCDWNGGSFNKSEDLLDTLDHCPNITCDGLTYEIEGEYGPFRVCTNFSKTGCKGR